LSSKPKISGQILNPKTLQADHTVYSVARLNREARQLLERGFLNLWVSGEVSNLSRPASGHIYFSLKDENAQVSCAMFSRQNRKINFQVENGIQVLVHARVSVYEPQGRYQLIIEHMEQAGEGLLRQRFEELKQKLSNEGLFSESKKKPLPSLPNTIGIITSPSGAAIRDILNILKRRYPLARIIIYPTRVQGKNAEKEIINALNLATQANVCEVLILARGGGSLEDLWTFNEESVARSIYECPIPLIAGIGHEIDVTIADLVADQRAPTPSGAAEIIAPDANELKQKLESYERRCLLKLKQLWSGVSENFSQIISRFERSKPSSVLQQLEQKVDISTKQLIRAISVELEKKQYNISTYNQRLKYTSPSALVANNFVLLNNLQKRISLIGQKKIDQKNQFLTLLENKLNAVSPLATLERGYAIINTADKKKVIQNSKKIEIGQEILIRLAKGELRAKVIKKNN
ncbi:MAG: exodeoxyribonuclease VII large subunit, partial [Pseudomonadota bacterium]|nr:exodeoxyribonuclease VII large subunit [Pseudomonadota bacterium]